MTILGFRAKFLEMVISQKWPHLRFNGRWQNDRSNIYLHPICIPEWEYFFANKMVQGRCDVYFIYELVSATK